MNEVLIQIAEVLAKALYELGMEYGEDSNQRDTYIDAADALSDAVDLAKESE